MPGGIDNLETSLGAAVDEMRGGGEVLLQFRVFGDGVEGCLGAAVAVFSDEPVDLGIFAEFAEPWGNDNQRAVIRHCHAGAVNCLVTQPRAFKFPRIQVDNRLLQGRV